MFSMTKEWILLGCEQISQWHERPPLQSAHSFYFYIRFEGQLMLSFVENMESVDTRTDQEYY